MVPYVRLPAVGGRAPLAGAWESREHLGHPQAGKLGCLSTHTHLSWVEGCFWELTPCYFYPAPHRPGMPEAAVRGKSGVSCRQMPSMPMRVPGEGGQGIKCHNHEPHSSCLRGTAPASFSILVVWLAPSLVASETGICPSWPVRAHPGTSAGARREKLSTGIVQPAGCGPHGVGKGTQHGGGPNRERKGTVSELLGPAMPITWTINPLF